jgi:hypothetical protein
MMTSFMHGENETGEEEAIGSGGMESWHGTKPACANLSRHYQDRPSVLDEPRGLRPEWRAE